MNIYVFQILNYTLSFVMWMILGRVVVTLISAAKDNVISGLFRKVTEPIYQVVRTIVPFAVVPPEKQGTMWGAIGGCIPFFSFLFIMILRIVLIILFAPPPFVK
jgi:hypothetical protein